MTSPAGWYPDPSGGSGLRYWDGKAWTAVAPTARGGFADDPANAGVKSLWWRTPVVLGGVVLVGVGLFGLAALLGVRGGDGVPPMDEPATYYHIDDSASGVYETDGPNGAIGECIWQRWHDPDDDRAFDVGTIQPHQRGRVKLRAGEYFVSYGCEPWRYAGG